MSYESSKQSKQKKVGLKREKMVQDFVSMYRCRFKQGISDASIMGTLHSAASVI